MTKYYEVQRTLTCKAVGSKEGYYCYDRDVKQFANLAEVKAFLKETYGKCKREKSYRDGENGEPIHTGYVYCYNTPKVSYDDTAKHNQDWITVKEIKATTIIV